MLHITGAFFLVGGSVAAAVLEVLSRRAARPSETALYLRLFRPLVPVIGIVIRAETRCRGSPAWRRCSSSST